MTRSGERREKNCFTIRKRERIEKQSTLLLDKMGCGSSKTAQNVQTAKPVEKKTVLPPIDKKTKTKTPSAKSNGSTDSGIEDSEPIKRSFFGLFLRRFEIFVVFRKRQFDQIATSRRKSFRRTSSKISSWSW